MSLKKIIDLDLLGRFLDKVKDLMDGDFEEYKLVRAYTTHTGGSDGDGSWPTFTGYLIFSCICQENDLIKYKTFRISEELYLWDNLQSATATYSEATLGAPPSAAGVNF